jgi:hypothetical protein
MDLSDAPRRCCSAVPSRMSSIGFQTFSKTGDDFYTQFNLLSCWDSSEERAGRLKAIKPRMKLDWMFDGFATVKVSV